MHIVYLINIPVITTKIDLFLSVVWPSINIVDISQIIKMTYKFPWYVAAL